MFLHTKPQIPVSLQIQPEFRASFESITKCQRRQCCHAALAIHNLIQSRVGPAKMAGKFFLRDAQGLKKFFKQHLARVRGRSFLWLHNSPVIIDYLNIQRIFTFPAKDNPPLVIDANTPEPGQITPKLFQSVARRDA